MGPDRNVADGEQVVLRVIIRRNANNTSCHQNQGRIYIDRELNIALFVPVEFKFGFLLGRLVECLVLLLLVLYLFLDNFINFTKPFGPCQHFGLGELEVRVVGNSILVDMDQDILINVFALNEGRVVLGQLLGPFLNFEEECLLVLYFHSYDGLPDELEDVYVLAELGSHLV